MWHFGGMLLALFGALYGLHRLGLHFSESLMVVIGGLILLAWVSSRARQLLPVLSTLLVVRTCFFEPFFVQSASMLPTLAVGEMLIVHKWCYGLHLPLRDRPLISFSAPKRGDIVVFSLDKQPLVKRVAAIPGDRVRYKHSLLYINEQPAKEVLGPVYFQGIVPSGQYFVLGDNPAQSEDSRHFGTVPADCILGRVTASGWTAPRLLGGHAA